MNCKHVADDVAGQAEQPHRGAQQAGEQAQSQGLVGRLGGRAALLQHGSQGVHQRTAERAQHGHHHFEATNLPSVSTGWQTATLGRVVERQTQRA